MGKRNPFRNADRLRNFLYHCLVWQYGAHPVPKAKLSKADERHFILLCRFVTEWWHYNTHQHKNISNDDEYINCVKNCTDVNLNDPVVDILHVKLSHVFHTMRAWVDEFGTHYSGPPLPTRRVSPHFTLEAATEVGMGIANDVELVDIVAPYGDGEAREALMKAVKRHQQYYLTRASRDI